MDGKWIVSGSWDRTLKVWDAESDAEFMTLKGNKSVGYSVCFSPNGKRIVSGSIDRTIKIWDSADPKEVAVQEIQGKYLGSLEYEILIDAITQGDLAKIEFLLGKYPRLINMNYSLRGTPLFSAVKNGHTEIIEFLISKGAEVNAKDKWDWTPSNYAAANNQVETFKLLLSYGGGLQNELCDAVILGDIDRIKSVLSKDQKPTATPLS